MRIDNFDVKAYPDLGRFSPDGKTGRKCRICIATEEIAGPILNGGIGSTYFHLARRLAEQGHDVTVAFLKGNRVETGTPEYWIKYFAKLSIKFIPMVFEEEKLDGPALTWQKRFYHLYQWLKDQPKFDVVHTSEWRGGAYYALSAKRAGIAFQDTVFIVKSSSPYIWNRYYQRLPIESTELLVCSFAEQKCIEWADIVIGGSAHLLSFMEYIGYDMPKGRVFVQPNILDFQDLEINDNRPVYQYGDKVQSGELVFFGRLEARKGLEIFCDALDRLEHAGTTPEMVTFMGKQGAKLPSRPDVTTLEYLEERRGNWSFKVQIITNYTQSQAINYLCEKPRIAVMPSLIENSTMAVYETLHYKIPFIATGVGGTPELIDSEDHDSVIVDPHPAPLSLRLTEALKKGCIVAKPAFDNESNLEVWTNFHNYISELLSKKNAQEVINSIDYSGNISYMNNVEKRVHGSLSICIYNDGYPSLLRETLQSIKHQTVQPEEVIIVTDRIIVGEKKQKYEDVKTEFENKKWIFMEQEHQCIGNALNRAAKQATGEVLLFLYSGIHTLEKEAVEIIKRTHAANRDVLCFSFYKLKNEKENDYTKILPMGGDLAANLLTDEIMGLDAFSVSSRLFFDIDGLTEAYHISGVMQEFCTRAIKSDVKTVLIPETLYVENKFLQYRKLNEKSRKCLSMDAHLEDVPLWYKRLLLFLPTLTMDSANTNAKVQLESLMNSRTWRFACLLRDIANAVVGKRNIETLYNKINIKFNKPLISDIKTPEELESELIEYKKLYDAMVEENEKMKKIINANDAEAIGDSYQNNAQTTIK